MNGKKVVGVQSTIATVSRDAHWLQERPQFIHSRWSKIPTHNINWKWHEEMPGLGSCIACSVDDLIIKARRRDKRWCKVEVSKVVVNRRNRKWRGLFLVNVEPFIAGIDGHSLI